MAEPHYYFSRIKNLLLVFLKEAWYTIIKLEIAKLFFFIYLREISRLRSADFFFVKEGNLPLYKQEILNVSPIQEN